MVIVGILPSRGEEQGAGPTGPRGGSEASPLGRHVLFVAVPLAPAVGPDRRVLACLDGVQARGDGQGEPLPAEPARRRPAELVQRGPRGNQDVERGRLVQGVEVIGEVILEVIRVGGRPPR